MFGPQIRRVKLEKQSELRIELQPTSPLRLRLLDGKAEIFGYELPHEVWITFPPLMTFAVFTWYGATIEIDGITGNEYISYAYGELSWTAQLSTSIKTSCYFLNKRFCIFTGDIDSGKSTLAKMLLNWAVKDGWKTTFVDLNVGQSSITIPGTIAAAPIKMLVDPVEGFPLDKALIHYFGLTNPSVNLRLYRTLVEELARELKEEFSANAESRASGMVIDTMGFIVREGYALLLHAIRTFNASLVIVVGQEEKLVYDLKKNLKFKKNLQVLNLEKSEGVFSRSSDFRKTLRNSNIQNYFYGVTNDLTVYTKTVKFSDVQVYRIGDFRVSGSTSAHQRGNDPLKITLVTIDEHLVNKVLAISYAIKPDQIISSIVAGFVCIKNVDISEERITYVSPSAAELPSKILILGTLTWHVT
ncbi:unnamed protein product [Arabidopsis thaliana]|uniref:Protein CLP1 homolog n=1 Tax=Arabidopsis thaliana TaxID=3702 RepID=A0A5S9Y9Q1_ARATH|nr:unnamed protein product [Arabidopsis thaliana]